MTTGLQDRAGKNAAHKPFAGANAAYGTHRSYLLNQAGGHQILIPGPPFPGSGSKNEPPRAQDTVGQFDLGQERYMGARSRMIMTQADNLGLLYGITPVAALAGIAGDVVLVRPNGKAIQIGVIDLTNVDQVNPAEYSGAVGSFFCLAPGEDIVFIPDAALATTGTGLFVPAFVDGDLINHRLELSTQKQIAMLTPPGKVWLTPPGVDDPEDSSFAQGPHRTLGILNLNAASQVVDVYINPGSGADIRFTGAAGLTCPAGTFTPIPFSSAVPADGDDALFLPAGHSIKAALRAAAADVFFCGVVMELNQAHIGDEAFAQASIVETTTTTPS